jgi:hypothetical protein
MADQRYEREIDELLQRLETQQPTPLPFRRRASPWALRGRRLGALLVVESAVERLMLAAVGLLVATMLLGLFAPRLAAPIAALAIACFVLALVLSVCRGASGRGPRHPPSRPTPYPAQRTLEWDRLLWRLRGWLRRFRR